MATRTIEDRRDRFATILVAPLMSCSARLPVYVLFIGTFVPDRSLWGGIIGLQALTLFAFYCLGALVAIPVAWLLKRTLLKGDPPPFLLELPSYKTPDLRTVLLRVYHSSRAFVVRAGSLILATTIAMWALAYFPRSEAVVERHQIERQAVAPEALDALAKRQAAELVENSYLGQAGHWVAPVVRPLGWDWRIGMAVIASFPAREVIISALGTIYSLGAERGRRLREPARDLGRCYVARWPPDLHLGGGAVDHGFLCPLRPVPVDLGGHKKRDRLLWLVSVQLWLYDGSRLSRRAGDLPSRHGLGLLTWTGKRQWPSPLPRSPQRTCCGVWRGLFSATNPTAMNRCR